MSWMRENAKWLMGVTIGLFILGFIALPAVRYFTTPSQERYLGTIDGKQIEMNKFLEQVDQQRNQYLETHQPPLSTEQRNEIRQEALKQITNQVIMQNIVQREGGKATSEEIRQYFSRRFSNNKGRINQNRVNQILRNMSRKRREELSESSRQQIETFRMIQWVQNQVQTSDTEFEQILETGLREVDLYGIYVDPKKIIPDEKVQNYYETNKDDFLSDPKVYLREIVLNMNDTAPQSGTTNLDNLKQTIDTIRRRHKAGDSFAELAREYSADTQTAPRGGLRGWVTPDELPDELSRVAFGTDTGVISNLVRTPGKVHLLYVEEGPKRTHSPLDEVRSTIENQLLADTHWDQASNRITQIREQITSSDQPFRRLKELAFLKSHSDFASPREGSYGWVPIRFVIEELHPLSTEWVGELSNSRLIFPEISQTLAGLETNELSETVRSDGGYHLFYIDDYRSARTNELTLEMRERIRRVVNQSKNNSLLNKWLQQQRKQVSISLEVPKSRVGGKIPWQQKES